jgi:hypothetical protein
MNTLAVFGLAASVAIGTVIGVLLGMCWVEERMIGSSAQRRSRTVDSSPKPPRATIRIKMTLCTRRAGFAAKSAMTTGATLASTALSGRKGRQSVGRESHGGFTGTGRAPLPAAMISNVPLVDDPAARCRNGSSDTIACHGEVSPASARK